MAERLSRAQRRQQEFENDLAQQGADRQQQAGMMQQLQGLYGIMEAPSRLRATEAQTAASLAGASASQAHANTAMERLKYLPRELDLNEKLGQAQVATAEQDVAHRKLMSPEQVRAASLNNQAAELNIPFVAPSAQSNLDTAALNRKLAEAQDTRAAGLYPYQQRAAELGNTGAAQSNEANATRLPYIEAQIQSGLETEDVARKGAAGSEYRQSRLLPVQEQRGVLENQALQMRMPYLQESSRAEIDAVKSRTGAQDFDNQWAQSRAMLEDERVRGQIKATEALAAERQEVPPQIIPYLIQMGVMTKEQAMNRLLNPEEKEQNRLMQEQLDIQKAADIQKHKSQQSGQGESNAARVGRKITDFQKTVNPFTRAFIGITDWLGKPSK